MSVPEQTKLKVFLICLAFLSQVSFVLIPDSIWIAKLCRSLNYPHSSYCVRMYVFLCMCSSYNMLLVICFNLFPRVEGNAWLADAWTCQTCGSWLFPRQKNYPVPCSDLCSGIAWLWFIQHSVYTSLPAWLQCILIRFSPFKVLQFHKLGHLQGGGYSLQIVGTLP